MLCSHLSSGYKPNHFSGQASKRNRRLGREVKGLRGSGFSCNLWRRILKRRRGGALMKNVRQKRKKLKNSRELKKITKRERKEKLQKLQKRGKEREREREKKKKERSLID